MVKIPPTLLSRRQRLRRLLADLNAELEELEKEVAKKQTARELTVAFFWKSVAPLLQYAPETGFPNLTIQQNLGVQGIQVPNQQFRVFLNRMKRRGWIELMPHLRGHGGWRLTEAGARELGAQKRSRGS